MRIPSSRTATRGPSPSARGHAATGFVAIGALVLGLMLALPMHRGARRHIESAPAPAQAAVAEPLLAQPRPAEPARERGACPTPEPALAHDPDATKRVAATLSEFTALFRAHLPETDAYPQLRRCSSYTATDACKALLTDALYEIIAMHAMPAVLANSIDVRDLVRFGPEAVYAAVRRVLGESNDPVERVSTLIALRSIAVAAEPLPKAALDGLANKPVVEAQLLLRHYAGIAIDDPDVLRETSFLARSSRIDSRVQQAALGALAGSAAAGELAGAVRELAVAHDAAWSGWRDAVAPALGRCGMQCADAIDSVFGDGFKREVAADMLRAMAPSIRSELLARLSTRVPPDAVAQLARETDAEWPQR